MLRRTVLLCLLLAAPATADTLLTVHSSVEGLKMDQPTTGQVHIWIAAGKLRRDEGETSTIVRLDRGKVYVLNHTDKTYLELAAPDLQKLGAPAEAQMKVQVTATGETKKVGAWNARKYKVDITNQEGLHLDTTIWASKDVASYQAYGKLAASLAAMQPGSGEWARQMQQIEGFPVVQEADVTVGGSRFKTREELVAVETKDAPAGTYEPPAGYKGAPAQ
ncbi:MAG TPA: DUF4412 domain-containing protein [Thermoanaerobaculia bacterium]|jgi:hypothetical protein|nr:DUF4412 domain-containing protein [Thermoanaerobaculia bacterium]